MIDLTAPSVHNPEKPSQLPVIHLAGEEEAQLPGIHLAGEEEEEEVANYDFINNFNRMLKKVPKMSLVQKTLKIKTKKILKCIKRTMKNAFRELNASLTIIL